MIRETMKTGGTQNGNRQLDILPPRPNIGAFLRLGAAAPVAVHGKHANCLAPEQELGARLIRRATGTSA